MPAPQFPWSLYPERKGILMLTQLPEEFERANLQIVSVCPALRSIAALEDVDGRDVKVEDFGNLEKEDRKRPLFILEPLLVFDRIRLREEMGLVALPCGLDPGTLVEIDLD